MSAISEISSRKIFKERPEESLSYFEETEISSAIFSSRASPSIVPSSRNFLYPLSSIVDLIKPLAVVSRFLFAGGELNEQIFLFVSVSFRAVLLQVLARASSLQKTNSLLYSPESALFPESSVLFAAEEN